MKKRVVIIIPYFGKFPNYFDFWLASAIKNPNFDFLFFTDNFEYKSQKNITFINMTFQELKNLLQKEVNFPIYLKEPYKLCDYRPLFGKVFEKYISNYDFWGFGDIDLILGDLDKFITPEILSNYDKIFYLGHLTLIKNTIYNNNLWKVKHHDNSYRFDEAFRTPYNCHFDEIGFEDIAEEKKLRIYKPIVFADIDPNKFPFFLVRKQHKVYPGLFEWKNGELNYYYKKNNNVYREEVAYAHFQKRHMRVLNSSQKIENSFLIIPNRIITEYDLTQFIGKMKLPKNRLFYRKNRINEILTHIYKRHIIQQKIYQSLFRRMYRKYFLDRNRNL